MSILIDTHTIIIYLKTLTYTYFDCQSEITKINIIDLRVTE